MFKVLHGATDPNEEPLFFKNCVSVGNSLGSKACVEQINSTQPPPRSVLTGGDVSRCLQRVVGGTRS